MKVIKVKDKVYNVNFCKHCSQDKIEYNDADEPWHDEQWICENCDSTYVIFNEDIATLVNRSIV